MSHVISILLESSRLPTAYKKDRLPAASSQLANSSSRKDASIVSTSSDVFFYLIKQRFVYTHCNDYRHRTNAITIINWWEIHFRQSDSKSLTLWSVLSYYIWLHKYSSLESRAQRVSLDPFRHWVDSQSVSQSMRKGWVNGTCASGGHTAWWQLTCRSWLAIIMISVALIRVRENKQKSLIRSQPAI